MNLDQAEQWAAPYAAGLDDDHPFVTLMANYHHMRNEITRLQAVITRYETGAQEILDKINPEVNR